MFNVRSGLVLIICVLLLVSFAYSGDDVRKGYFRGWGVGLTPIYDWNASINKQFPPAFALNVFLGYAWSNKDAVVVEANRALRLYKSGNSEADTLFFSQKGIWGINWYHYFNQESPSFFSTIGAGMYYGAHYSPNKKRNLGFLAGCGYEFRPHWQVGLYASGTKTYEAEISAGETIYYQVSLILMHVSC
ncbi:MAG: hypothetical protein KAR42_00825 [candidate division Zixibacteria bacterium]|nr:hypothetical protein [candidate division Zixibacteria bacterium]